MSLITISLLIGIFFSLLASGITYIISHRRYFLEAYRVIKEVKLPEKPRGKGDLRRYKKLKKKLDIAKKRIILLFFIHLGIFLATYTTMIVVIAYISENTNPFVSIPISIPLLSGRIEDHYVTHVYFLSFIGYVTPLYLLIRSAKINY